MQTIFQDILNLLISPQGSLVFHLILAFSIIASLQTALISRQASSFPHKNRLIFGLGMLLLGQLILFFSSGLAWQNILDGRAFLPPLDRAVMLFSVVWIIWLWSFPTPAKLGDTVTGFLNLGIVILFLFTYSSWSWESSTLHFNQTWWDQTWELSTIFLVIIGMTILFISRPPGWGFGLGMLSLILAGTASHLLWSQPNVDLSAYLRLGYLAAFPVLPTLVHRVPAPPAPEKTSPGPVQVPFPRSQERRRYSADPRTMQAWLSLNETTQPEQVLTCLARAIAQTMLSDLCFIVSNQSYRHIVLQAGYDLVSEEELQGTIVEQKQAPTLSSAVQRGKPLRMGLDDSTPVDFEALKVALGLKEIGSLMFVPLFLNEKPYGGLLLLSPYSYRQWSLDDQGFLSAGIETIARILNRARQEPEIQPTTVNVEENIRIEMEFTREENRLLLEEISELRGSKGNIGPAVPETDIQALVALQQEAQEQINRLQAENENLQAALNEEGISAFSPDEFARLEVDLRETLGEIALLQNQLAEANARNLLLERETRPVKGEPGADHEVIASIIQDIRQPMTSIIGYTDLLLAESVGILGALQRKFLERIKASTEKMRLIMDDLIQVTVMSAGPVRLLPEPIEMGDIIDAAVADTAAQLREKNITLWVDLPSDLPKVTADRDALQQIITHLLRNAGAATPPENTITLRAGFKDDAGKDLLLLQVTDTGSGVQPEDLPKVFSHRHKADLPLIQGLGDTGVGLSTAKALTEAHGGRIWVDSIVEQGTTFNILLPIHPNINGADIE